MKSYLIYAILLMLLLGACQKEKIVHHEKSVPPKATVTKPILKPIVRPPGKAQIPGAPVGGKQQKTQTGTALVPTDNASAPPTPPATNP